MASQNGHQVTPAVVNGRLAWDGLTQSWHEVTVEQPAGWNIAQPAADNKDNTIAVHHRPVGFGMDAGNKTGRVTFMQTGMRFPAGTYALRIDLFNHAQPTGPYDASWQVAVISPDSEAVSKEWWITRKKGERTLYAVVRVVRGFVGALELRYTVRYASVQGEMQLRRVTFTDEVPRRPDFRLVVGAGGEGVSGVMLTDEGVITIAKTDYDELMETLKKIKHLHQEVRRIEGVYEAIRDIEDLYQEVRELLPSGNE